MHIPRPHRCPGDIPFCQGASCAVFAKAPFSAHGGGRAPETTVAITSCCQRRAAPVNSTARNHSGDHILLPTACCTSAHGGGRAPETTAAITSCCHWRAAIGARRLHNRLTFSHGILIILVIGHASARVCMNEKSQYNVCAC